MKQVVLLFLFISSVAFSQEKLNQFDEHGKRHGKWQKKYEGTNKVRYSGEFKHGKEIGVFKFYHKKSEKHPSTIKTFNEDNDIAEVKHYTSSGKLVSQGKMKGKELIGKWVYYQKKSNEVLSEEFYKNGLLEGVRKVYYHGGKLAEEENYQKGKLHGERKMYSETGVLIKHFNYVDGEIHGKVQYFDGNGKLAIDGKYNMGKRVSIWKYYKNGKLYEEKDYTISKNPYKKKT
ncbi:MAG: toxin-antitoxin system YwqK family antitoxin [Flavobacteriaceae bacterium]|nr:toxin-antitoxin system YwqK family antitoxin [Flavobacteriaceae bacterium]